MRSQCITGDTLREMRRYNELEQLFAKDAASGLIRDPWTQLGLAVLKLEQGDPVAAQALLAQVPLEFSPNGRIWTIRFTAALYLRDYDAANRVIAATPAKFAAVQYVGQPPESWADGQVARARGDKQKAQSVFAAARKWLDAAWVTSMKEVLRARRAPRCRARPKRRGDPRGTTCGRSRADCQGIVLGSWARRQPGVGLRVDG